MVNIWFGLSVASRRFYLTYSGRYIKIDFFQTSQLTIHFLDIYRLPNDDTQIWYDSKSLSNLTLYPSLPDLDIVRQPQQYEYLWKCLRP